MCQGKGGVQGGFFLVEIEGNNGKDLSLYDMMISRKKASGNSSVDKSTALTSSDITVNDLIEFVNTGLKKESVQFFVLKKCY